MSPWHFGDFAASQIKFGRSNPEFCGGRKCKAVDFQVNPGFWDLQTPVGDGGGQPDPHLGDPRVTQEVTGTVMSLGGTTRELGPALSLPSARSSWKAKPKLKA